jgi:hypothetical protein
MTITSPAPAGTAAPAAAAPPTPAAAEDAPVTLGFRTFTSGADAARYYYGLINTLTVGQALNEYEHVNVLALLRKGHPEARRKVGGGVAGLTVRPHAVEGSPCFHLLRPGGAAAAEDFSTKKCLVALFPAFGAAAGGGATPVLERERWVGAVLSCVCVRDVKCVCPFVRVCECVCVSGGSPAPRV